MIAGYAGIRSSGTLFHGPDWEMAHSFLPMFPMLHNVIKMASAMNDTVYFNDVTSDDIEDKIGFDDEHSVTECLELLMFWNSTEKRMCCQATDSFVKLLGK